VKRTKMRNGDPLDTADKVVLAFKGHHVRSVMTALEFNHPAVMVIGNPGSGKSTTLNRYAGCRAFGAGFHAATGLTSELQTAEFRDAQGGKGLLIDTPGLADIDEKKRESAAAAIFNGLMMVEDVRVFFVITLEEGRIRPADVDTVRVVLKACEDLDDKFKYGLIVNKCPRKLMKSGRDQEVVTKSFQALFKVERLHVHFAPNEEDLLEENACAPLGMATLQFMKAVPMTRRQKDIKKVNINAYKVALQDVMKLQADVKQQVYRREQWQRRCNWASLPIVMLLASCCWLIAKHEQLKLDSERAELEHRFGQLEMQDKLGKMEEDREEKQEKLQEATRRAADMEKRVETQKIAIEMKKQQMTDQLEQKEKESAQAKVQVEKAHRVKQLEMENVHSQVMKNLEDRLSEEAQRKVEAQEKVKAKELLMENHRIQMQQQLLDTRRDGDQAKADVEDAYEAKQWELQWELEEMKDNLQKQVRKESQLQAKAKKEFSAKQREMQSMLFQMQTEVQETRKAEVQAKLETETAYEAKLAEMKCEHVHLQQTLAMNLQVHQQLVANSARMAWTWTGWAWSSGAFRQIVFRFA